ncbi:PREDICTED: uncharacterized protein LOC106148729, partial [Chinchilla lanigera]|uniref:uncharacterized protein LOC106148729 n=1 Tax=Chinchilla lanigera TaxID=34839 RepID=UPI000697EE43
RPAVPAPSTQAPPPSPACGCGCASYDGRRGAAVSQSSWPQVSKSCVSAPPLKEPAETPAGSGCVSGSSAREGRQRHAAGEGGRKRAARSESARRAASRAPGRCGADAGRRAREAARAKRRAASAGRSGLFNLHPSRTAFLGRFLRFSCSRSPDESSRPLPARALWAQTSDEAPREHVHRVHQGENIPAQSAQTHLVFGALPSFFLRVHLLYYEH